MTRFAGSQDATGLVGLPSGHRNYHSEKLRWPRGGDMCGLEILFDAKTAASIRSELTKAMGGCPCRTGVACPLLPDDLSELLARPPDPSARLAEKIAAAAR